MGCGASRQQIPRHGGHREKKYPDGQQSGGEVPAQTPPAPQTQTHETRPYSSVTTKHVILGVKNGQPSALPQEAQPYDSSTANVDAINGRQNESTASQQLSTPQQLSAPLPPAPRQQTEKLQQQQQPRPPPETTRDGSRKRPERAVKTHTFHVSLRSSDRDSQPPDTGNTINFRAAGNAVIAARRLLNKRIDPKSWALMTGDVTQDLPSTARIVRIFLSSTFTDTKEERNALLKDVFPELRKWCQERGYQFQVVDMRWGIRDEATDDHRTQELCLREIERCQQLSTGPSFVTLVSHKYGNRFLPREIEAAEFEQLVAALDSADDRSRKLLEKWFRRDDNAVPPNYVLQPVSSHYPDNLSTDKVAKKNAGNMWWEESQAMHAALIKAALRLGLSDKRIHELTQSVTEAEIRHGLLCENFLERGLWFYRHIGNIDSLDPKPVGYKYKDCGETGGESRELLEKLKSELRDRLPQDRVIHYNVDLDNEKGLSPELSEAHRQYIETFSSDFEQKLKFHITKAIRSHHNAKHMTSLLEEVTQHIRFCREKCRAFCGRQDCLQAVREYLTSDKRCVYVIHGESGSGKTSIMAKAAQEACRLQQGKGAVILRFLGTTPDSTTVSSLLASIILQLHALKDKNMAHTEVDIPLSVRERAELFHSLLADTASAEFPLTLLLDSLDQLDPADEARQLHWLPKKPPRGVKLIMSTLSDEQYEVFPSLKVRYEGRKSRFYEIPSLDDSDVGSILDQWLELASPKRQLTPGPGGQRSLVVEFFKKCPLPLFLKLSFDTACRWPSFWSAERTVLQDTVRDSINALFARLETIHGKLFVSRALGYLTVTRAGLTETELEDVLSCDDDVLDSVYTYWTPPVRRLPPLLLVRLKADLEQYLVDRGADGVRVFYWYHRQFIEAARERYCGDVRTRQTLHSSLADLFAGTWAEGRPKEYTDKDTRKPAKADRIVNSQPLTFRDTANLRRLNNLPYHCCQFKQDTSKEGTLKQDILKEDALEQGQRKDDALSQDKLEENMSEKAQLVKAMLKEQCLLNLQFLQTKLLACGLRSILDDFLAARRALPDDKDLMTVAEALQTSQSGLQVDPTQLPAQVLGRLTSPSQTLERFLQQCRNCDIYLSACPQVLTPAGGQLVYTLRLGGDVLMHSMAMTEDGQFVVSDDWDGSVYVVHVAEGRCVRKMEKTYGGNPDGVHLCFNDSIIVASTTQTHYKKKKQCLEAFKLHTGAPIWVRDDVASHWCVCGEGRSVIATLEGRTVTLHDVVTGEKQWTIDVSEYVQTNFEYYGTRSAGSKKFLVVHNGERDWSGKAVGGLDLFVISLEEKKVIARRCLVKQRPMKKANTRRRLFGPWLGTKFDDEIDGRHHQGDGGHQEEDSSDVNGGHHEGDSSEGNGGHQEGDSSEGNGGHQEGDSSEGNGGHQEGDSSEGNGGHQEGDSSEGNGGHDEDDDGHDFSDGEPHKQDKNFVWGKLAISRDEKHVVFWGLKTHTAQPDPLFLDITTLSAVGRDEAADRDPRGPVKMTADGRYLYYGYCEDVHIWDLTSARNVSYPLHAGLGNIEDVVTTGGKKFVTISFHDHLLRIWDVSRGPQQGQTTGQPVSGTAEGDDQVDNENDDGDNKDGRDVDGDDRAVQVRSLLPLSTPRYVLMLTTLKVMSGSKEKWDWFLQVYDVVTKRNVRRARFGRLSSEFDAPTERVLLTEGTCVLVHTVRPRRLKLIDVDKMAVVSSFQGHSRYYDQYMAVSVVRTGGEMRAVTHTQGRHHVKVYNVATGRVLGIARQTGLEQELHRMDKLVVNQEGTVAVAEVRESEKHLVFDLRQYRHVNTITNTYSTIDPEFYTVTSDGRYFLYKGDRYLTDEESMSQTLNQPIFVYDLQDGKVKNWTLGFAEHFGSEQYGAGLLNAVALLDDGHLLSAHQDGCVRLFDIHTGAVLQEMEDEAYAIYTDPACPLVVTSTIRGETIMVWRKNDMTRLCSLTPDREVKDITLLADQSDKFVARADGNPEPIVFTLLGAEKDTLLGNQQPLSEYPETYQGTKLDLEIKDFAKDVGTDDENDPDDDDQDPEADYLGWTGEQSDDDGGDDREVEEQSVW